MKTTVDIPDDILHRAKILSAQRRSTLKEMIVNGLKHELDGKTESDNELKSLLDALSKGRNTEPVGRLNRESLYDRSLLH